MFAALHISPAGLINKLAELQRAAPSTTSRDEATHAYRFTLESAWLLSLASDTARENGGSAVNSLHLLYALLSLDSNAQRVLLSEFQLRREDVLRRMRRADSTMRSSARVPLADEVQIILGYAIGEAWNRGHLAVAPIHLAMGLARAEKSTALDVLAELGVSQADLTDQISSEMPPTTLR
jgi:ATP-dependent Clp protease ATP-binding subunit ClpA